MTTSTLAILILVSTISYFIVSRLSLRGGSNAPTLRFISRLLAVFILGLTASIPHSLSGNKR